MRGATDLPVYIKVGEWVCVLVLVCCFCLFICVSLALVTRIHHTNNNVSPPFTHTHKTTTTKALDCEAFAVAQRLVVRGRTRYHCNEVHYMYVCMCVCIYIRSVCVISNHLYTLTNTHLLT